MEEQLLCRGRKLGSNDDWEEGYFVKYQPNSTVKEFVCGIVPSYASALYIVEVDPASLLRFTGHKDKNNIRIFEGDVVKWKYKRSWGEPEHVSKVIWDDFYHSWKLTVPGGFAKFRTDVEYEVVENWHGKEKEGIRGKERNNFTENSVKKKPCSQSEDISWNRWYVNKDMLPRLQDTVLICKGWYDENKYQDIYEALKAYLAKITNLMIEDVCYDHILNALLLPACEAFLNKRQFCEIFYEKMFKQDIVFHDFRNHIKKDTGWKPINAEYVIDLLINSLFKLSKDEFGDNRDLYPGFQVI